jgi:hypothetical protein
MGAYGLVFQRVVTPQDTGKATAQTGPIDMKSYNEMVAAVLQDDVEQKKRPQKSDVCAVGVLWSLDALLTVIIQRQKKALLRRKKAQARREAMMERRATHRGRDPTVKY